MKKYICTLQRIGIRLFHGYCFNNFHKYSYYITMDSQANSEKLRNKHGNRNLKLTYFFANPSYNFTPTINLFNRQHHCNFYVQPIAR